jgi:serine/threonine protein kinase
MSICSNVYAFDCLWAFLRDIFFMHSNGVLHCNLSPNNILFYTGDNYTYIGICNWGFASRMNSPPVSKYNYKKMNENKVEQVWVDLTFLLSIDKKKLNIVCN